jgi:hypothetical protein
MSENPIVEEVHRVREEILSEYAGDIHALIQALRTQTEEAARAGRQVVNLPPRPPVDVSIRERKVG